MYKNGLESFCRIFEQWHNREPVRVMFFTGSNSSHAFFVESISEKVFGFGRNVDNQLGIFTKCKTDYRPKEISFFTELKKKIRSIVTGGCFSVFQTTDYEIYVCGSNAYGQLGLPGVSLEKKPVPMKFFEKISKRVLLISCGKSFTHFLTSDGSVYGVGDNGEGNLGCGDKIEKEVICLTRFPKNEQILDIKSGEHFSLFLSVTKKLFCTGLCRFSCKSHDGKAYVGHVTPSLVLPGMMIKKFYCGVFQSTLMTTKGNVFRVPDRKKSQVGRREILGEFVNFATGGNFDLLIDKSRNVYGFGSGEFNQFGNGKRSEFLEIPKRLTLPIRCNNPIGVFASHRSSYLVTEDAIYAAGCRIKFINQKVKDGDLTILADFTKGFSVLSKKQVKIVFRRKSIRQFQKKLLENVKYFDVTMETVFY